MTSRILRFALASAIVASPLTAFAATVSIQNLLPGTTVPVGTVITFTASTTGFSTPSFYLNDTYSGSSLVSTNISSTGVFSWTPLIQDIGAHTITVLTQDTSSNSGNAKQDVTIVPTTGVSIGSLSPGSTVTVGTAVTFTAATRGFSSPSYSVSDSFANSSVSISKINLASGVFSWTPTAADVGAHMITVQAQDAAGHYNSAQQQINVNAAGGATTQTSSSTGIPVTTVGSAYLNPTTTTQPVVPVPTPTVVVPQASGYYFSAALQVGSTGADVTALQNILIKYGYLSGAATGYFGTATQAAVQKYQTAHGLSPLGTVGPSTRVALNAEAGGTTTVATPTVTTTSSTDINKAARALIIQQLLAQLSLMQTLLVQLQSL